MVHPHALTAAMTEMGYGRSRFENMVVPGTKAMQFFADGFNLAHLVRYARELTAHVAT